MSECKYVFEDITFYDRESGHYFEGYNLKDSPEEVVEWIHNYSHTHLSLHECYSSALLINLGIESTGDINPYEDFTLQELMDVCERIGVKVEIVEE